MKGSIPEWEGWHFTGSPKLGIFVSLPPSPPPQRAGTGSIPREESQSFRGSPPPPCHTQLGSMASSPPYSTKGGEGKYSWVGGFVLMGHLSCLGSVVSFPYPPSLPKRCGRKVSPVGGGFQSHRLKGVAQCKESGRHAVVLPVSPCSWRGQGFGAPRCVLDSCALDSKDLRKGTVVSKCLSESIPTRPLGQLNVLTLPHT